MYNKRRRTSLVSFELAKAFIGSPGYFKIPDVPSSKVMDDSYVTVFASLMP